MYSYVSSLSWTRNDAILLSIARLSHWANVAENGCMVLIGCVVVYLNTTHTNRSCTLINICVCVCRVFSMACTCCSFPIPSWKLTLLHGWKWWLVLEVCILVRLTRCYPNNERTLFPSVLWRCWLGDRKDIRPVKNCMLVCWWWWFDWSFARLIAPVVQ